ncbi:MAG: MFS transporter [Thermoplasmata archaeon]
MPRIVDGYRSLFANRRFRFYFLSQAVGDAGYAVYAIAVLWLALSISHSLLVAGIVTGVEFGIYAMSFLAGPIVDRAADLRTVLLLGYPLQGAVAAVLGGLAASGALTVPILLVLVVALSALWDFTWTATNAIVPRIVDRRDLFRANGLTSAVSGGNQVAGYAAGAALILLLGPSGGILLYAALNVAAALLALPVRAPRAARASARFLEDLREGWRYLTGDLALRELVSFSSLQAFFSPAPPLLIALFATVFFASPAEAYGILVTAFALGGVVGSLGLGHLGPRRRLFGALVGVTLAEGVGIAVAIVAVPVLATSVAVWFAIGAVDVGFYVVLLVYFQATAPEPLVGRTLANAYLFRGSSRAVGAVVVGALAASLPARDAGIVVAAGFVAIALAAAVGFPRARSIAF